MTESVSCVVCGDTIAEKKPHPAPILLACSLLGAEPECTVFAGDDVRDIEAGRAAGTQTLAVHYGYGSNELTGDVLDGSFTAHHATDILALFR